MPVRITESRPCYMPKGAGANPDRRRRAEEAPPKNPRSAPTERDMVDWSARTRQQRIAKKAKIAGGEGNE